MHLDDTNIQILGTGFISFIKKKMSMNFNSKRRVIQALLDGMEKHQILSMMVHNCCVVLLQFQIPQDIFLAYDRPQDISFAYSRLTNLLTIMLEKHNSHASIPRDVTRLLKYMASNVDVQQNIETAEAGHIEMMLQQISCELQANTCDKLMKVSWSSLWNRSLTNSEHFLRTEGLSLFNQCYTKFSDENPELVSLMLGVIGNIAGVYKIRDQLMTNEYLEIFCSKLLDYKDEDIQLSYSRARVLAHLASVGDESWTRSGVTLSRKHINMLIVQAVNKWDLQASIHTRINYISFKPIFRLLSQWHAIGSQYWAVWTLANLTTTNKQKYCCMVTEETESMKHLEQFSTDPRSTRKARKLARTVIKNVEDWKNNS